MNSSIPNRTATDPRRCIIGHRRGRATPGHLADALEPRVMLSGSISGTVWRDADGDGAIGARELKMSGWVVYLDQNRNHRRDAGETFTTSTADGTYAFAGLSAGTYYVAEEMKPGWELTYPSVSAAGAAAGAAGVEAPRPLTFTGSHEPAYLPEGGANAGGADGRNAPMVPVGPVPTRVVPTTHESLPLIGVDRLRGEVRLAGVDGRGFSVAVIDTGIDRDHPLFGPDADENGVTDNIIYQHDFAEGDDDASDPSSHGSNVASIIASSDASVGVASGAGILALKVFTDSMQCQWGYVEAALQWVVANADAYNIAAVNMSLGDLGNYDTPQRLYGIDDELAALAAEDVIVVSAAGNEYPKFNTQGVGYPAADPNSLGVGAVWDADVGPVSFGWGGQLSQDYTTGPDRVISFSQRSTSMTDIFAPGGFITGATAWGQMAAMAGTSQAAPHVTGAAVLAQQLAMTHLGRRLTPAEFKSLLGRTGVLIRDGDDENDSVTNTGATFRRLDVKALADAVYAMGGSTYPGGYRVALADGAARTGLRFGDRWLPIVPGTPHLKPESDSGVSSADDLTNHDNNYQDTAAPWLSFWVSGIYEGAKVFLYADGQRLRTAVLESGKVGPGGSVGVGTFADFDLADGVHRITARQQVPNRLTSEDSPPLFITVDTTPPPAPSAPDLQPASDSGLSSADNITNDSTPVFAVSGFKDAPYFRVSRTDGTVVGRDYETISPFVADAQPDGTWQYVASAVDAAGNASAPSDPLTVTIDTAAWQPPDLPTPGYLDQSIDPDGREVSVRDGEDQPERILVRPDGKYVVVGRADGPDDARIELAGYLPNGRPDPDFGTAGRTFGLFQDSVRVEDAVLEPGGKILVAGTSLARIDAMWSRMYSMLARYNADGSLDATFGDGGRIIDAITAGGESMFEVNAVVVQPDRKIVVAGSATMFTTGVARLLPDGRLDPSFGGDGLVTVDVAPGENEWVRGVALGPDGTVVVAGGAMSGELNIPVVARLTAGGGLDPTFDADGVALLPTPPGLSGVVLSLLVQPDGKVVIGGDVVAPMGGVMRAMLLRTTAGGVLDSSFGAGGIVVTDLRPTTNHSLIRSIRLQPDGKIVAVGEEAAWGWYTDCAVARFLPNGSFDGTFGPHAGYAVEPLNNYNTDGIFDAAVLPDGKLVAVAATWSNSSYASVDQALMWFTLWSAPQPPGLADASDSGFSSTDNVTNDATPTIEVPVPTGQGLGYRVYRNGVLVSGPFETSATWTAPKALQDGWSKFSYVAIDAAGNTTMASRTRSVKIDRARPVPGPAEFAFQTAPHRLTFRFNEDVSSSLGPGDVTVQQIAADGTASAGPAPQSVTYDKATNVATCSFAGVLADGNYRAVLGAWGVTDVAGNALATAQTLDFFFLRGDVNHDRRVTADDAKIVNANIGRTNATYAQGDVNYDSKVTQADAGIVAAALGRTLPAPPQSSLLEAEAATVSGAAVAFNNPGYTGTGFVDFVHTSGDYVEWTVDVAAVGRYALDFRYANGATYDRPLELRVDGQVSVPTLSFAPTGGWGKWGTVTQSVLLTAGRHLVRLTASGRSGPNVDSLIVRPLVA